MKQLALLLRKDLQLELRAKETIVLLFATIVALSALVSSGIASAFVEPPIVVKVFPTVLWTVFFFTAALSSTRAYEHEIEMRAFEGLVMSGASDWAIFLSKVLSSGIVLLFGYLLSLMVLGILTDVPILNHISELFVLGGLITFGYNSISTLLVAVSSTSRLRGVLLPLLLFPLIFPLFFAAIELTFTILGGAGLAFGSPWLSLVVGFDIVFFVAGLNLYRFALYD